MPTAYHYFAADNSLMSSRSAPLQTDYRQALQNCLPGQEQLMQMHLLPGGESVWVRKAGAHHARWRSWIMSIVTRFSGISLLAPPPKCPGNEAVAVEIRRLRELQAAGVTVPQLLAYSDDALMISSLGGNNLWQQWRADAEYPEKIMASWCAGLDAVSDVHRKNTYLSQAFARNMMVTTDGSIGFIDFEDDPGMVLPLPLCQAKDFLCYLHSSAFLLKKKGLTGRAAAYWQSTLAGEPEAVRNAVNSSLKKLRLLKPFKGSGWGSDAVKLAAMSAFYSG